MPPRRDAGFMDVDDSDSDISIDNDIEGPRKKNKGKGKATDKGKSAKKKTKTNETLAYTWEASYTRSWDTVQEDEAGSLQTSVEELMARGRRRRLLAPAAPIRRTIIRHLIIILDLSQSMMDRDMRPTRFDLTLQYTREFIAEWFDQNPLGQIGIVGMRAGLGERIGELSGNPQEVLRAIADRHKLEPTGEPSLQNAIEMARSNMKFNKIRISVVALAAEMKICRELCDKTGGQFGVAMNEGHYKDLLFELVPPPAQKAAPRPAGPGSAPQPPSTNPAADLMMMGFPTRLPESSQPTLCVCHSELKSQGFLCPRCQSKVCDVPTDCDVCGLMIVSSPHLARSYHHLFPVKPYIAIPSLQEITNTAPACHGCSRPFPTSPPANAVVTEGVSPVGRYRCPECSFDFCSECDIFVHDVVHTCPGCAK
ncbi:RNA polymerase II transcription factor [Coprinopsis cinerea AmutBmut pab1-1]|nr:RNA polymerase II transcription factor [Coprinopsis cinerea AmutBmut pab1-1]